MHNCRLLFTLVLCLTPPAVVPSALAQQQPNRRTFVRAILQYTDIDRNAATNQPATTLQTRRLFSQYLFSFKINPQSVLLAGYSGNQLGLPGGDLTMPRGRTDLTHTDRTFFLKIGYAWVL